VDRDRLVLGLAAVFAGLTVLLVVLALSQQPFLLVIAVPFGATTYLMWYQATGRLARRTRTRRVVGGARFGRGPEAGGSNRGGFAADERRGGAGGRARAGPGPGSTSGYRRPPSGPSEAEAYRTLGLDRDADEKAIRQAYRRRVKEVHPDTPSGDEEDFKRVNRAYERLTDDAT
jgi:hypothetical protein